MTETSNATRRPGDGEEQVVDLTLHGMMRIRLIDPRPVHHSYLLDRIGAAPADGTGEPHLLLRFRDTVARQPLTRLGLLSAGFSDEGFFLLGRGSRIVDARLPFGEPGLPREIVYRRSLDRLPLLLDIIRLVLPSTGHVAVHAMGCVYEGRGLMVMGWPKGGKTGVLLSLGEAGAAYVGDEWIFLSGDGERMVGMPTPIRVSPRHAPALRRAGVRRDVRTRMLHGLLRTLDHRWVRRVSRREATLDEVVSYLQRRARISVPPTAFFDVIARDGARPDVLFLIEDSDTAHPEVIPVDPRTVAHRMLAVDHFEDAALLRLYDGYRFAVPEGSDALLSDVHEVRRTLLQGALAGKRAFLARHPYTGSVPELLKALRSVL